MSQPPITQVSPENDPGVPGIITQASSESKFFIGTKTEGNVLFAIPFYISMLNVKLFGSKDVLK